jgi:hypothetical protein
MLLPLIKQPQTAPTEEVNQSAIPFLKFLQTLPETTVSKSYCTSPLNIESQLPFWINQNYGSNTGEQYLVSFLQAYYNWMYCGFKKEGINLTPYDIEELLNIDSVPDEFLNEYIKAYAPFITISAIQVQDRQNIRKFLRSIKTDFLINKGTENSYRYLLKILFNVSNVTIDYPKKYLMRLNGGKYIDFSWDLENSNIIDLPSNFDPDNPINTTNNLIAGGVGYDIDTRPNLFGAALNEAVLPDEHFWQEYSYLLTSDASIGENGYITYKDTLLAGAHPAGMLGFFEEYIPLADTDVGADNNGDGVVDYRAKELPIIGRYLLMYPGITFAALAQPGLMLEGSMFTTFYSGYTFDANCSVVKNYTCYCCEYSCDPDGTLFSLPQHKLPLWDANIVNEVKNKSLAHMTINSFIELELNTANFNESPNISLLSCTTASCATCP